MEMHPLVSVIIPCYNVAAYIERAVLSILNQTYPRLEIFLIDDASTDDTLLKIKSFQDERVNVIELKENTQKIGAVNIALSACTGDLIAFQDADDWSEFNRIELQVSQFRNLTKLGICFTNYKYVNLRHSVPNNIALTDKELKDEFLKFGYNNSKHLEPTMCATMMISRAVLTETNGYHPYFAGRVAEDIYWVYKILKKYKGIAINKPLYNINSRDGSLTQLQHAGKNAKSAYSWQLLSKIIYKDMHEHLDVLSPDHINELRKLELEACEEALLKAIRSTVETKNSYENSTSFRLGRFITSCFHFLKLK
ncbi:glycosyltransferase family 2 protein [Pontibacter pudoricolor]|uniref:glycosyltransferase family 2 protein n=1 Tax=Pontibacter pudoricolor TaxID=2694930 RepID=UPI001390AB1B|nr:glycosyltransferase family 2 protein [Pontibacter pudoricolor]